MKTRILMLVSVVGLLISCDMRKQETSQRVIDSLRTELDASQKLATTMEEVGVLMDSIDANRHALRVGIIEGTPYASYVARLRDINQYVIRSQAKIIAMEKTIRRTNAGAYQSAIKRLKADLETRNQEMAALTERLDLYKTQNDDLIKLVNLKESEIQEKLKQIKVKQEETAQLEQQVSHLMIQSRIDEGESYYARAIATEETAKRTRFAPKKKKETIKAALELYKLAFFFGKNEAGPKVSELEKRLGKSFLL